MNSHPLITVVIPAYNQANYLAAAIQSVLAQSYPNWELLVVNDASPDATNQIVGQFSDPRVRLLIHEQNRGLPAARNTGMRAAQGDIIALLDADDRFHPEKLKAHVAFLAANPTVGVSYNARYEIGETDEILAIWRPSPVATLADVVLGFPFAPSDMVLCRDWAIRVNYFDESYVAMSEDLDINCRLALAGCTMAGIDRALNYRRYYPNRAIRNVPQRLAGAEKALAAVFTNPACPPAIQALRDQALSGTYLVWAYEAFVAGLTALAQSTLAQAGALNPTLLAGTAMPFLTFLVDRTIHDGGDHARAVQQVMEQLPLQLTHLRAKGSWVTGQADLLAGLRELLWDRTAQGEMYLRRAALQGQRVDRALLRRAVDQLMNYRAERGNRETAVALQRLAHGLQLVATHGDIRWLEGCYWINHAFHSFQVGEYPTARNGVLHAFRKDPGYLRNRGAWSTLVRSVITT